MIQRKAKKDTWYAGKRWRPLLNIPTNFKQLDFANYNYILGDKIFSEASPEAEAAFDTVIIWIGLQAR